MFHTKFFNNCRSSIIVKISLLITIAVISYFSLPCNKFPTKPAGKLPKIRQKIHLFQDFFTTLLEDFLVFLWTVDSFISHQTPKNWKIEKLASLESSLHFCEGIPRIGDSPFFSAAADDSDGSTRYCTVFSYR